MCAKRPWSSSCVFLAALDVLLLVFPAEFATGCIHDGLKSARSLVRLSYLALRCRSASQSTTYHHPPDWETLSRGIKVLTSSEEEMFQVLVILAWESLACQCLVVAGSSA